MNGPLANHRHEKFAQALAKGMSQVDAYVDAGYKPNDGHAARLAGNGRVQSRLAELQAEAAKEAVITAADIARQLDEDRAFAQSVGSAAACVSATMGKAKVLGLLVDRTDLTSSDRSMSPPSLADFYAHRRKADSEKP
ncbi:hypothetical protein [Sphingobium yanoikuyae]|uniref:hypothetical protein n=1 Tax=Sphingobium yanoikuyae TaxID=13690 RepID=UPI0028B26558|nr:hypothetical protein [Sphingobium yanoikuyae]